MARTIGKLKPLVIARPMKRGWHGDGGGLYLQVSPSGAKSWLFRYMKAGKARAIGLGSFNTITLPQARALAAEQRKHLLEGRDPLAVRKEREAAARLQEARSITFAECAKTYITSKFKEWRNAKHQWQWGASLKKFAEPTIGALPVAAIDTELILKILEPIWTSKTETASRVRGRIELILDWATVRGYRTGENPARWRGHLDKLLTRKSKIRKVSHYAALPYRDMPEFMPLLRDQDGVAARALQLVILTAARTGEVIGARWLEFDLNGKVWTIPAERMKTEREHRVPLPPAAISVLKAQHEESDGEGWVFPGARRGKPLSNMAMLKLLDRIGYPNLTVHGFRSTFRDWAAETTSYPNHVVEKALAHLISSQVEAAYRRGDLFEKRRRLMQDWAKFCSAEKLPGRVVSIRAAR